MRSFEAGDTYQILVKGTIKLGSTQPPLDQTITASTVAFDFGEELKSTKEIKLKFSNDPSQFKLNQDINKKYANIFSQAEEIADCTIRGDAAATQRIQGDETKKVN